VKGIYYSCQEFLWTTGQKSDKITEKYDCRKYMNIKCNESNAKRRLDMKKLISWKKPWIWFMTG
jgi:hypothetical protein